jgi:hypothetical protein
MTQEIEKKGFCEAKAQYIVEFKNGTYEDSTNSSLTLYVLVDEDRSTLEIAKIFRDILIEATKQWNEDKYTFKKMTASELFTYTLNETCDGLFYELYELLESNGFYFMPNKYRIKKWMRLYGMNDWLGEQERNKWAFREDGSVSTELFDVIEFN